MLIPVIMLIRYGVGLPGYYCNYHTLVSTHKLHYIKTFHHSPSSFATKDGKSSIKHILYISGISTRNKDINNFTLKCNSKN